MTGARARASIDGRGRNGPFALVAMLLAGLALLAFGGAARAQSNAIESVTSVQQGGATVLRIQLKAAPAALPPTFTVANPPRLALDFADTGNGIGTQPIELSQGDARSVIAVQASGRTRVVLNLRRPVTHAVALEGRSVLLTLEPVSGAAAPAVTAASAQAYSFAKADTSSGLALRDIDFRRGKDGEGRVVVELSNPQAGVDVKQQGQSIVVDFLKARVPENLRRRLDVTDFGTPVRSVRTFQQGDNTRMVIEPTGLWEHNAYQSDTQFVIEVKAIKEDPNKLVQGTRGGYRGDKLSLNFQNVDVRALLQVIADFTNLNIVVRDSVAGSITLRLKDVPWDQALDIVLQSKNLDMRKNGNVILVAPREELATQEKLELESRQQIAEIEPTRVETFHLNYQKAESVAKLLADDKQRVLSKTGSAVPDVRTNKLFVRDTASRLDEVRRIIQQLDIAVRQVLIEARIVEADDRFSRNLGVKFGFNDIRSTVYRTGSVIDPVTGNPTPINVPVYGAGTPWPGGNAYSTLSGNLQGVADLSSQLGSNISGTNAQGLGQQTALANTNFVNLPAGGISGVNPASFAVSLFGSSLTRFVNLEISALEAEQRGKVVSSPRVLTSDQGKAVIEQGTELPYQTATSSGATSIAFRKANLKLEVTPQITPEGGIILDVDVNNDTVSQTVTTAGYAIDTKHVQTQVLVENGGTVVIGGIFTQDE
ncbi:MAG: Type pilus biosis and competence protein pilQ precursor, partial [Pseudomonadota bacterium]